MKRKSTSAGLKVRSQVKAGGISLQHHRTPKAGLRVKSQVKAGGISPQHSRPVARA